MKRIFIYNLLLVGSLFLFQNCNNDSDVSKSAVDSTTGVAGSTARFAVVGDFLYAVNHNSMKVFNVNAPNNPIFSTEVNIGTGIETIFPFAGKLFIGSRTGMFIFDIGADGVPQMISNYEHIESCDPVATNGQYAYVTLRSNGDCRTGGVTVNQLQILDVTDVLNPTLVAVHPMSNPLGVGVSGNTLFICDQGAGFKVFDATDPLNLVEKAHFPDVFAKDVIVLENKALVITPTAVHQFDYIDLERVTPISSFEL